MEEIDVRVGFKVPDARRVQPAAGLPEDELAWLEAEVARPAEELEDVTDTPVAGFHLGWVRDGRFRAVVCPDKVEFEEFIRTALLDAGFDIAAAAHEVRSNVVLKFQAARIRW